MKRIFYFLSNSAATSRRLAITSGIKTDEQGLGKQQKPVTIM